MLVSEKRLATLRRALKATPRSHETTPAPERAASATFGRLTSGAAASESTSPGSLFRVTPCCGEDVVQ